MHISEIVFFNLHNYLPWDFLIHISAHPPYFQSFLYIFTKQCTFHSLKCNISKTMNHFLITFLYHSALRAFDHIGNTIVSSILTDNIFFSITFHLSFLLYSNLISSKYIPFLHDLHIQSTTDLSLPTI